MKKDQNAKQFPAAAKKSKKPKLRTIAANSFVNLAGNKENAKIGCNIDSSKRIAQYFGGKTFHEQSQKNLGD